MQVIICYDISDNRIRYRMVKYLEQFAIRVQYSVFKADMSERKIKDLNSFGRYLLKDGSEGKLAVYKVAQENLVGEELMKLPQATVII